MEFPGIKKEIIQELDPPKQRAIRKHIREVETLIQKKEGLLQNKDPNEKFLEFQGFAQLDKYEQLYKDELKALLTQLGGQTDNLTSSISEEIRLVKEIRRLAASSEQDDTIEEDLETLKNEITDDTIIAHLLRDQQDALDKIHGLTSKITHISKQYPELCEYAAEFDIIRSLLDNIIKDEFPLLDVIYNLANIPGSATVSPSEVE